MGREEVPHVEGRILAHEDDVEEGERDRACLVEVEMDVGTLHREPAGGAVRDGAVDEQVLRFAVVLRVAAPLPFELERERGVLVDQRAAHRVHDVEDAQRCHRAAMLADARGWTNRPGSAVSPAALAQR